MERRISLGPIRRIRAETVNKSARVTEAGCAGIGLASFVDQDYVITGVAVAAIILSEGVRRTTNSVINQRGRSL